MSDNGKTFKTTARILICSIVNNPNVQQYLSDSGIKWTSNLPIEHPFNSFEWVECSSVSYVLWNNVHVFYNLKRYFWLIKYDELLTTTVEVEGVLNLPLNFCRNQPKHVGNEWFLHYSWDYSLTSKNQSSNHRWLPHDWHYAKEDISSSHWEKNPHPTWPFQSP